MESKQKDLANESNQSDQSDQVKETDETMEFKFNPESFNQDKIKRYNLPFYKRQYIIDKSLQYQVTGYFLLLSLLPFIYMFTVGIRSVTNLLQTIAETKAIPLEELEVMRLNILNPLKIHFALAYLLLFLSVSFGGVLISHRIAGPMYRFLITLRLMRETKSLSTIHIRKDDFFQELKNEINNLIEVLKIKKNSK